MIAKTKIILGPNEIAGWHLNLCRGLRELGADVTYANVWSRTSGLEEMVPQNVLIALLRFFSRKHLTTYNLTRWGWALCHYFVRALIFMWALITKDVFIYCFGTPWVHRAELVLLSWLEKTVIVVYHGSDTRPAYIDGCTISPQRFENLDWCRRQNKAVFDRVRFWERFSTPICSPTCAQFFTRPVINWQKALGMPFAAPNIYQSDNRENPCHKIKVLHCPSNPSAKGTDTIRKVVANLQSRYDFEFVEIHGKPHAEVLNALNDCTFAIDQLSSDLAFSGFGCEAAHHRKIAIVAGYAQNITQEISQYTGMPMQHFCRPEYLEETIELLLKSPQLAVDWGEQAYAFVTTHWSNKAIAERMLQIISGNTPDVWWFDPKQVVYIHGAGVGAEELTVRLKTFETNFGRSSFLFDDKPTLQQALDTLLRS